MQVWVSLVDAVDYKFKQGEIFRRVKATTLISMMLNVYEQHITVDQRGDGHHETDQNDASPADVALSEPARPSSRLQQCVRSVNIMAELIDIRLISGVGEIDKGNTHQTTDAEVLSALPFLILDLRDADDYAKYHLFGGVFRLHNFLNTRV